MSKLDTYNALQRWVLNNVKGTTPENLDDRIAWFWTTLRAKERVSKDFRKNWTVALFRGLEESTPEQITENLQSRYRLANNNAEMTATIEQRLREHFKENNRDYFG